MFTSTLKNLHRVLCFYAARRLYTNVGFWLYRQNMLAFHFIDSKHVAPVYTRLFSIKSAAKHLASCTWGMWIQVPTWGDQVHHWSVVILPWGCARVTSVTYPRQTGGEPLVKGDNCFGREFDKGVESEAAGIMISEARWFAIIVALHLYGQHQLRSNRSLLGGLCVASELHGNRMWHHEFTNKLGRPHLPKIRPWRDQCEDGGHRWAETIREAPLQVRLFWQRTQCQGPARSQLGATGPFQEYLGGYFGSTWRVLNFLSIFRWPSSFAVYSA